MAKIRVTVWSEGLDPVNEPKAVAVYPDDINTVVLDDAYIVYGMRIIRRADGAPQLLYPEAEHVRTRDQKQAYAFRPLSSAAHRRIEQAVLQAYSKKIGGNWYHV